MGSVFLHASMSLADSGISNWPLQENVQYCVTLVFETIIYFPWGQGWMSKHIHFKNFENLVFDVFSRKSLSVGVFVQMLINRCPEAGNKINVFLCIKVSNF